MNMMTFTHLHDVRIVVRSAGDGIGGSCGRDTAVGSGRGGSSGATADVFFRHRKSFDDHHVIRDDADDAKMTQF